MSNRDLLVVEAAMKRELGDEQNVSKFLTFKWGCFVFCFLFFF